VRGVPKTLVAALAVLLLAVGLVACGGGDSSNSTAAESGQGQSGGKSSQAAEKQGSAKSGEESKSSSGNGGGDSSSGGSSSSFVPKQHSDSGGGSQQYRVKGGDNSVQEFGGEADTSELDAAAAVLHNFLDARAEENWAAACDYMSKDMIESIKALAAKAKVAGDNSCGGLLAKLTNPAAKQSLKEEAAQADVGSLRIEGEQAFVIYSGPHNVTFTMPMTNEGGAWKVTSLAATPLS
jgi:hypothetical protein